MDKSQTLSQVLNEIRENYETKMLQSVMSYEEQIQIAFIPLCLAHIIWSYADEVLSEAGSLKLKQLLRITRTIRELRNKYNRDILDELDYKHRVCLESQTDRFMEEYGRDFALLYFAVNGEFKKKLPNFPYDTMRSKAIIAMMFIDLLDKHNRRMDNLIRSRLGYVAESIRVPMMCQLYEAMKAIAGETGQFDFSNTNVKNGISVLYNRLLKTEFEIKL